MVEREFEGLRVGGSNPPRSANNMVDVAEWLRRNTVDVVYARSNRVVHPKTGSRGMVLSRLHRRQEHAGSNPVFPTIRGYSTTVSVSAFQAEDVGSIPITRSRKHTASFSRARLLI